MTHGHELQGGMWEGGAGQDGVEWGGEWDYCNSIINKYINNNNINKTVFEFFKIIDMLREKRK